MSGARTDPHAARSARTFKATGARGSKTDVPATAIVMPASASARVFSGATPPSPPIWTCSRPRRTSSARSRLTLSIVPAMNACPPKPGSTDMTSATASSSASRTLGRELPDGVHDVPGGDPRRLEQLGGRARAGHVADGEVHEALDVARDACLGERREDRVAEPAFDPVIFDDAEAPTGRPHRIDQGSRVDRLHGVGVDHAHLDRALDLFGGLDDLVDGDPRRAHHDRILRLPATPDTAPADADLLELVGVEAQCLLA